MLLVTPWAGRNWRHVACGGRRRVFIFSLAGDCAVPSSSGAGPSEGCCALGGVAAFCFCAHVTCRARQPRCYALGGPYTKGTCAMDTAPGAFNNGSGNRTSMSFARPDFILFLPKSGGNGRKPVATTTSSLPFWARHEFLIRRLHSLTGLIPVGAFMTVHLLANASVLEGPATFQRAVYQIHSLGSLLPLVEWLFIFLPILFHGIFGVAIVLSGRMNYGTYRYGSNFRYVLQRVTGILALLFIIWHVFHMHGWFHAEAWLTGVAEPLGGHQFRPFNAASTLGTAMSANLIVPILYAIGVLSCVFHLANGIWTMGISWGVWTSPAGQRRANGICLLAGIFLAGVGMSALFGAFTVDSVVADSVEDKMFQAKVNSGEISRDKGEHKRTQEYILSQE